MVLLLVQSWLLWRLHDSFSWPTSTLWPIVSTLFLAGIVCAAAVGLGVAALSWHIAERIYLKRMPSRQSVLLAIMSLALVLSIAPVILPRLKHLLDRFVQHQADRAYEPYRVYSNLTEEVRLAAREPALVGTATQAAMAFQLLALSDQFGNGFDWNHGNAIHYSNILLGRIALAKARVPVAAQYLLRAADTDGSPHLNDYGPDMTLAQELLWSGEESSVLDYLGRCERFWHNPERNRLKEWSEAVCQGRSPNFGTRSGLNPAKTPR